MIITRRHLGTFSNGEFTEQFLTRKSVILFHLISYACHILRIVADISSSLTLSFDDIVGKLGPTFDTQDVGEILLLEMLQLLDVTIKVFVDLDRFFTLFENF